MNVDPAHKRVDIRVAGTHFDGMIHKALIEAASFLEMDVADLKVLGCGIASVTKTTRFNGDLSNEKLPEEWEMYVTVGVDITPAELPKDE